MTKNEIISELTKRNPRDIERLRIVYHNRETNVKYVYVYDAASSFHIESRKELGRVLLSLYKLRKYVECIHVIYFPSADVDYFDRYYDFCQCYVHSVVDFIKTIKK